jgi:hypothetical protein
MSGEMPKGWPRIQELTVMPFLVIGALVVLAGIAASTPFLQRPASLSSSVGLGTFQVAVATADGVVMLALLVVASAVGVLWPDFLRPRTYRQGVLQSLRCAALGLVGEILLFIGIVVVGFPAFYSNSAQGPVVSGLQEVLHGLMALVAVVGGVLIARAVLLLRLALTTSRS